MSMEVLLRVGALQKALQLAPLWGSPSQRWQAVLPKAEAMKDWAAARLAWQQPVHAAP
ncbi:MAG: hypothetical protein Q8N13_05840 [Acidovorax sp.]|nr:hypothetical protein [Acidovorax sp.]